jgi:apolipoprotein N-acyltransferase
MAADARFARRRCHDGTIADLPDAAAARPALAAVVLPSLAAGVLLTLSVPPSGFWPLAIAGFAVLYWRLGGLDLRGRIIAGAAAGLGLFGPGIFWITDFQAVGYVALVVLELSFVALAGALTPPGRGRELGFPAAVLLSEALRNVVPFGGFPLGGVALGQVSGPLAFSVRIGGPLLLVGLTATAGMAVAELARRRVVAPAVATVVIVATVVAGVTDGSTHGAGTLTIAVVQGGGVRGMRAVHSDPNAVFVRHVDTTGQIARPADVVLWPEDVVALDYALAGSPEEAVLSRLAGEHHTTLIAGIVEDVGADRFRNAAVAFGPTGTIVDRYDKVHRVPFGEYVPGRELIGQVADLSIIPRDAIPGAGPGILHTPAGKLGVVISYEVFFTDRARAAIRAGGDVLLVPTNASSYKTSQVPTQELAAARLRAIETGRDVIQAGPTGYSAFIDDRGRLLTRTTLGEQAVLERTAERRHGLTPYMHVGDWPVLALAGLALGLAWALTTGRLGRTTAPAPALAEDPDPHENEAEPVRS